MTLAFGASVCTENDTGAGIDTVANFVLILILCAYFFFCTMLLQKASSDTVSDASVCVDTVTDTGIGTGASVCTDTDTVI